jgi:hypothetical protein
MAVCCFHGAVFRAAIADSTLLVPFPTCNATCMTNGMSKYLATPDPMLYAGKSMF